MTDEEYEKKVKGTRIFCSILACLFGIGILINFTNGNILQLGLCVGFLVLLYLFFYFTKRRKIAGPIIGIILGILYLLQLNIISILIGIFVLMDCIPMLKYVKELTKE